jgi:arabinose-5-phosphate isomerase
MGDALAVACYERRGLSPREFALYHPGGRLGRKLIEVGQVMHAGERLPAVGVEASVAEAVREMSAKQLGMTCVVDGTGRLVGILTDGDLRRRLLKVERPMEGGVADALTPRPTTIGPGALATEALRIMEERKITSIPVVADEGRLMGVVQIHDLWRTELF